MNKASTRFCHWMQQRIVGGGGGGGQGRQILPILHCTLNQQTLQLSQKNLPEELRQCNLSIFMKFDVAMVTI